MISLTDKVDFRSWDDLYHSSSTSNFFQSKECYQFYKELSFIEAFILGVKENGRLVGVACGYLIAEGNKLKKHFTKRAIIQGGLLLDNNISENALCKLLEGLKFRLPKSVIYLEIRNLSDYSIYKYKFKEIGFIYKKHLNFQVDTTLKKQDLLSSLSASKRRQISISNKNGAYALEEIKNSDIIEFYSILSDLYKKKIHKPLFPIEFFEKIINHSFSRLILVKKENIVLGGILLVTDSRITYEWFVCGQNKNEMNIYPSVLATWSGIEYAMYNNLMRFDFMGAGQPDENYGVREFKSKFGGKLVEYGRFVFIQNQLLYKLGILILNLKKRLF
jgi:lipid II:glycine glycyltransferase (peptidoglycan interpeptide bridge formation enzyme)